jgi:hypothetical protein
LLDFDGGLGHLLRCPWDGVVEDAAQPWYLCSD